MQTPAPSPARPWWLPAIAALALAACGPDEPQVKENAFPGQVSAGGATSGEIIARTEAGSVSPGSEGPEGTPGIPQGSGGTTSGPNMGGTTQNESGDAAPDGARQGDAAQGDAGQGEAGGEQAKAAAADEDAEAKAKAEMQKQQLNAAMDRAAARFEARQTAQTAAGQSSQSGQAQAGAAQSPAQAGSLGDRVGASQEPPRSEKHGTAPASEDVKQPRQPEQQSPDESEASLPSDSYKAD